MFRTVLVPQTGQSTDGTALEAANTFMRESDGHLSCVYIHDDAAAIASTMQTDALGVPVVSPGLIEALNEEANAQRLRAKEAFISFCKRNCITVAEQKPGSGIRSASWKEINADIITTIATESGYHDAIVMARDGEFAEPSSHDIGSIVISSGRPAVLMPKTWRPRSFQKIAVAWKDTPEAARAVAAALPLLERAKEVSVFCATEDRALDAARASARNCGTYLNQHGIFAESRGLDADKADVAAILFSEAMAIGADLLVMGAYGHSRLREFVFGGFTREVLLDAQIPVLLMH
jgi:nucleotide-binding universal stress UspA family protein